MDKLFKGAIKFREISFEKRKELYESLHSEQKPHTLFIGCSDSRVVPELITRTLPGELFVVRNIANIVPHYRVAKEYAATTSAIEYAVNALDVENIVVCGHSNCGGCNAIYFDKTQLEQLPNVAHWLEQIEGVKSEVHLRHPDADPEHKAWITEQINIVKQMANLLSYPYISRKYEKGELHIYGWYYVISKGEVYNFNKETGEFELIS
ncbi:Carbonate dehydratase [Denitrovibrio acetiphilus DSM 12809]|uniref:Carbonic anhydrase n=1 Tax=Denitrovibrio acetiphilus (strain DSM 12809 / NBRC 114555 / N2460) TaxID=522772 RepID=D4H5Y8_DENA2|nr:carbonic anhydrase [Denitrovibrio acetiphilus]ADD67634.1 Carbonate dehydratase [Denitrovibrio acetiphilus DSM 12809]